MREADAGEFETSDDRDASPPAGRVTGAATGSRAGAGTRSVDGLLRRTFQPAFIGVALTIILTLGLYGFTRLALRHRLNHLSQAATALQATQSAMLNEDISAGAYLDTGEASFLAPYVNAETYLTSRPGPLSSLPLDSSSLGGLVTAVDGTEMRWRTQWGHPATSNPPPKFANAAARTAFLNEGKSLFDAFDIAQAKLTAALNSRVNAGLHEQQDLLDLQAFAVATILALVLLITALQRSRLRKAISGPVGELRATMEAIRGGDLSARAPGGGPEELQLLAEGLTGLAGSLDEALSVAAQRAADLAIAGDRERIARDLHDGVIQSIFSAGMMVSGVAEDTKGADAARLHKVTDDLNGVIKDLRSYIFELRPAVMSASKLERAIRDLAAGAEQSSGVIVAVEVNRRRLEGLADVADQVVRVLGEALSNVTRHAGATTCRIGVRAQGTSALVFVEDDGHGFDPTSRHDGMGLDNLAARAAALGAVLSVTSVPGEGTNVHLLFKGPGPRPRAVKSAAAPPRPRPARTRKPGGPA